MVTKRISESFQTALDGKKIPILTLDHKWHKLFAYRGMPARIKKKSDQLNQLLMQQGKYNTEIKKLKIVKKNLMDEIVPLTADANAGNLAADQKVQSNRRLIEECNQKLEEIYGQQGNLPRKITAVNFELMILTMEECYDVLRDNNAEIDEIDQWLNNLRVELKKQVVRKQENELLNHALYSYMHDVFGAQVIELFDMKYVPERMKTPEFKYGSMA